ncbi:MAG: Lrp/AsnC family transcriptional regulator [Sphingobium sp.]|nr:Lrp/AsnC family transcriptional regulator [Sphingobium sp.]
MNGSSTRQTAVLDQYDRAILRILQQNNRLSQRKIAEQVNLSPAAVQRRIAAMETSGVIMANVAIVRPDAVQAGISIIVEVHLQHDRSTIVEPVKALFRETAEIQQCYYVTGNGGFILLMIVPDMAYYEKIARRLFADNEAVETYRTLVVLDRVKTGTALNIMDEKSLR